MADPVTVSGVVKIAGSLLTNEKIRKGIGWVLVAVLSPVIIVIAVIAALFSGTAEHNRNALDLCFYGGYLSPNIPAQYRRHITDMQACFATIDSIVAAVNAITVNGNGLDANQIKSVFYSLFFGADTPSLQDIISFIGCFFEYEQREREVEIETVDEDGVITVETVVETYMVAIPISSLNEIYANITSKLGVAITDNIMENISSVYLRVRYGGDSFSGAYMRGDGFSIELDASDFVDLSRKNNLDLVKYVTHAWSAGWGYVYGTFGMVLTESLFESKQEQYPDDVGGKADFIRDNWLGRRTADCVGLIKGYGWLDPESLSIKYGTNGMLDVGANAMHTNAVIKGDISTIPDIPGLAVWKSGHIGVYIGNGEVIEAMGTHYGVVKTQLSDRSWTAWLEIPYIDYLPEQG